MNKNMLGTFFYWMNERHKIHMLKERGADPPWTKDLILRQYKFTNPFRQNDAVTRILTEEVVRPHLNDDPALLFANICTFRMFNWPETYRVLGGWRIRWNTERAVNTLELHKQRGNKIFTGAYIITNAGSRMSKIKYICNAVENLWRFNKKIVKQMQECNSLEQSVKLLCEYEAVGKFIAYELVTDLRHTHILDQATDIYSWANPGPGAKRGLNRLHDRDLLFRQPDRKFIDEMVVLMDLACKELSKKNGGALGFIKNNYVEEIEMRDIEHSLCEFDKYVRVLNGEGRPRSKYTPKKGVLT